MTENSPIRAGFAAVHNDPAIAVIEIAWRWTFGLIGTVFLLIGTRVFLSELKLSEGDEQALRGHDPTMIAAALMHVLQQGGVLQNFFGILAAVVIPSAIVWIIGATVGRAATLRRFLRSCPVNVRAIFALTTARVAVLAAAVLAWYVWMFICAFLTITPEHANYPLYLLLSMLALPAIGIAWGLLNWILSLAPIVAVGENSSATESFRHAVLLARCQRSQFFSISRWLGLPRLAAMMIALIFAVIVLAAVDSAAVAGVAITIITLAYCGFADYLYVVRLAAYAQIARELPIATAATRL
jgi:hypothetical protein